MMTYEELQDKIDELVDSYFDQDISPTISELQDLENFFDILKSEIRSIRENIGSEQYIEEDKKHRTLDTDSEEGED